jgi:hypothetical protein
MILDIDRVFSAEELAAVRGQDVLRQEAVKTEAVKQTASKQPQSRQLVEAAA